MMVVSLEALRGLRFWAEKRASQDYWSSVFLSSDSPYVTHKDWTCAGVMQSAPASGPRAGAAESWDAALMQTRK